MSRISRSTILEVQERMDPIAVVEDYLRLEKRGGRYWGRCPFHAGGHEKTPSFKVDPEQKLYYCFGCSKGGGIIDFVMEMEKISYPDAIKHLARKFGIEIVFDRGGDDAEIKAENSRKDELLELYRRTALSFSHFLLEKPEGKTALDYLLSRKISREMIQRFRLGYSPADRNWLYRFLQGKGYSGEFLDNSGLFSSNYRGMAFFSNRLMFPIADRHGRIAAFGGRALPSESETSGKEQPKYINTREIETYKKGQTLFGLDLALPEIRRSKTVYLAEGYMDVIALHQAGITNAIAPCGTAFTEEQAKLLRNWADSAVLVFDSDEAGQNAAVKSIIICRKNGLPCSVVVPEKVSGQVKLKDPADILQNFGAETLNLSMKYVTLDLEYLIARSKVLHDITIPQGKSKALVSLYPFFDSLESKTERDACMGFAADEIRADKGSLLKDFEQWQHTKKETVSTRNAPSVDGVPPVGGHAAEKPISEEGPGSNWTLQMTDELFLLTLVSVNSDLYPQFRSSIEMRDIENPAARELFIALEECFMNDENGMDPLLSRIGSQKLKNFIVERGMSPEFRGDSKRDPKKLMEDGIRRMKEKILRHRLSEIGAELRLMERKSALGAESDYEELIAEKMHIDAEIRRLEGK